MKYNLKKILVCKLLHQNNKINLKALKDDFLLFLIGGLVCSLII